MALKSPRFTSLKQCQDAALNTPIKSGAKGPGVAEVQHGLIALGFPMPKSTKRYGVPDGIFGNEMLASVKAFQSKNGVTSTGVVDRPTMEKLDALLPLPRSASSGLPYTVPGMRVVLAQPSSMACWATVHAMMRSWKDQQSYDIRAAALVVGEKYAKIFDDDTGLPGSEFGPFIKAAKMAVEPMMSLGLPGWLDLLRSKGLLWVGTLNVLGPAGGLHSRIIEAMSGDGSVDGTNLHIIDPDGGKQYQEKFRLFIEKFEGAFGRVSGDYFQIRHFV